MLMKQYVMISSLDICESTYWPFSLLINSELAAEQK